MAIFGVISAVMSAVSVFMGAVAFMEGVVEGDLKKAVLGAVGVV